MNTTLHYYKNEFERVTGDNLHKVKTLLEKHLNQWALHDEGLVVDLLDDKRVSAEDIVETLQSMVENEDSREFKNAVLAMRLGLEKQHRHHAVKNDAVIAPVDDHGVDADNVVLLFMPRLRGNNLRFAAG